MMSELASKIVDALNGNEYWPSHVDVPHDEDIQVGPLTFRYGGGPKKDRWFLVEAPHPCWTDQGFRHDWKPDPTADGFSHCVREGCGFGGVLTSYL